MKHLHLIIFVLLALTMNISCTGQSGEKKNAATISDQGPVEVFYFHNTRRCATCNAVEDITKAALAEHFGNKIPFTSFNLEETEGKEKAEEIGVAGQTLVIVKGETKINLTNEGFMYARNNPEKLETLIKEKIDPLL
ncbi:MAG: nitrophenyl compound nitroreductase subunit ArsF family protein [Bacteroidales bacterium]|nr:nitrophenyl compound nitroreductase subunit ArsF family protein [Bacteroidales bacterium]MDT8431587.1 nitrophenyl compound nitroreductase subunit ArsF family protein [Bacteroidales bacterium]